IGKRFDTLDDSCKTKPIFATSYRSYRDLKSSFGSFYWRNGKPQIKFKLNKVEEFKLFLPKSLKKYAH
ncbi:MAG: hypothetical protein U9P38_07095, partial [Campylobacterota bacterium]|nr:hypothetical protein [Campylobacterota bacterium]